MITRTHTLATGEWRRAVYSDSERHRYTLDILWRRPERPRLIQVIGLNPSTATELVNDSTVVRCRNRAEALGFDGMVMTNLFAYRATDPDVMRALPASDAMGGPEGLAALEQTAARCELIVCAWGNDGAHCRQASIVLRHLRPHAAKFRCLGLTKAGHPKHPLYVKNAATLLLFNP